MIKYNERGITLVALVITVIVLLILAGVGISVITGGEGLFSKTREAAEKYNEATKNEENEINKLIEEISNSTEKTQTMGDGSWSAAKGINTPKLLTGMQPVIIGADGSTSKPSTDDEWYDYSISSKKWANAKTEDGSLWVWIPRFAYKIESGLGTKSIGTIDVVFVDINNKNGDITYNTTYPSVLENAMRDFVVHPAFVNNTANGGWDSELPGFWIAKFEAGFAGGNNSVEKKATGLNYTLNGSNTKLNNYYGEQQTDIYYPVFMGKTYSYNYINIGDAFSLSKALTNSGNPYGFNNKNVDTHLIKDSEWGAVTYLSHSKYGVNGADTVYINNLDMNNQAAGIRGVTGYSGENESANVNGMTTGTLEDIITNNGTISYAWHTINGQKASSNNNTTGVYDLSGGLSEYTSGYVNNGHDYLEIYGNELTLETNMRYKRVYPMGNSDTSIDNYNAYTGYGDALKETSSQGSQMNSWSGSYSLFSQKSSAFSLRGSSYSSAGLSGMWAFNNAAGSSTMYCGFRAVAV